MKEKKSVKKWVLLGICAVIFLAAAIVGVVVIRVQMNRQSYSEAIKSAEKSVESELYNLAEAQYKEAIEKMPKEEAGYLGLADLYLLQGETSAAKILLNRGYRHTGSAKIRYMLQGIEDGSLVQNPTEEDAEKRTMQSFGTLVLNTAFLQRIENYDYEDYCDQFGGHPQIEENSRGELEVVHSDLPGVCYYSNTEDQDDIVDLKNDLPAEDGMPAKISVDSLDQIFQNFSGTATLAELSALSSSVVKPVKTEARTYVELAISDLLIRIETDASGNIVSGTAWNEIICKNANKDRDNQGLLAGVVIDASTGEGVAGARITFAGTEDSTHRESVSTAADGSFSVELEADLYQVTIEAEGYVAEAFTFEMEEGESYSGEQFVISPELAAGSARIVLEWNAQPQDLDSYLYGETADGEEVSVNFRNPTCTGENGTIAELDVDDTNGYGPETITLNELDGVYTYTVVDYRTTGTLQQYGATVKIYLPGESSPTVITLDPNAGVQNVWEVFEIDHGEVRVLNRAPAEENLRPDRK